MTRNRPVATAIGRLCAAIGLVPAALGLVTTTPVTAADTLSRKPAAPVPSLTVTTERGWSGAYVGLGAGYGWGRSDLRYSKTDADADHGVAAAEPDGWLMSVTGGYNHQLGRLLLGVEADLGLMDVVAPDQNIWDGHTYRSRYGGLWGAARGRAGLVAGTFLFYGTAGLAVVEMDEYAIGDDGNTDQDTPNRRTRSGWVAGAGVEVALSRRVTGKLEYLHFDLGADQGLTSAGRAFTFENQLDIFRLGLNYRF